ncbi:hypothetical protein PGB90_009500 [Kerria lacca]
MIPLYSTFFRFKAERPLAINIVGITIFSLGALAVLLILYLYMDTLKHIMKYAPPLAKTHSAFVVSVYPVVGIATYCAIVVPRAHLLAEAMTQGIFMASLYQLFCLFVAYAGGEAELIKRVKPDSLILKVPPCCCWPCCFCLPLLPINKTNMKRLRLLVLQLPVVQGLVYMVLLVMWAEEESLYQVNYVYMQPVIIVSIFSGLWGMIMTMTMLRDVLKEHNIRGKFFALQLVLLLAKLQGLLARFAVWGDVFPCKLPITPTVYANLIYNSSMLWEMIVLGYVARKLYKQPVTDLSGGKMHTAVHICPVIPCSHKIFDENYNNTVRY